MILTKQQQLALNELISFTKSNEKIFSLTGYAGTGKTSIIKFLIPHIRLSRTKFLAPTNKASLVLQEKINQEVSTLHSFLSLKPSIPVEEIDINNLTYLPNNKKSDLNYFDLWIIDEASMINDDLYNYIISFNKQIIFIGDLAQLKPVKQDTLSLALNSPNNFSLTEILRTDSNYIIEESTYIRENKDFSYNEYEDNIFHIEKSSLQSFIEETFIPLMKESPLNNKIICGTNQYTSKLNQQINNLLYPNTNLLFNKGSLITAYRKIDDFFYTSNDYVIINISELTINKHLFDLKGYYITLEDLNKQTNKYFLISPEEIKSINYSDFTSHIYLLLNNAKRNNKWKEYFNFTSSFLTAFDIRHSTNVLVKKSIDFGYAITCHKSQGSTYNNILIIDDFNKFGDIETTKQLKYVALTRASKNVYICKI